jgi:hypothetical protein
MPDTPEERAKRQKRMARFQEAKPLTSPEVLLPFFGQCTHLYPLLKSYDGPEVKDDASHV